MLDTSRNDIGSMARARQADRSHEMLCLGNLSHKVSPEVMIAAVSERKSKTSSVRTGLDLSARCDALSGRGARPLQYRLLPAVTCKIR